MDRNPDLLADSGSSLLLLALAHIISVFTVELF